MEQSLHSSILKAGAKRFLKYGLRSVSIDDICSDLRISKKTFYTYFSQKEELVEAVLQDMDRRAVNPRQDVCRMDGNVIDKVMQYSLAHIRNTHQRFVTFFFDLAKYYPDIYKRHLMRKHQAMRDAILNLLNEGVSEDLFRDDLDIPMMTDFIVTQFSMTMNLSQHDGLAERIQKGFDFLIDTLLRALCNEQGLAYYLEKRKLIITSEAAPSMNTLDDQTIDLFVEHMLGPNNQTYFT